MASKIQGLFIDPPIAIARLGASARPVDCFFSLINLDLLEGRRKIFLRVVEKISAHNLMCSI